MPKHKGGNKRANPRKKNAKNEPGKDGIPSQAITHEDGWFVKSGATPKPAGRPTVKPEPGVEPLFKRHRHYGYMLREEITQALGKKIKELHGMGQTPEAFLKSKKLEKAIETAYEKDALGIFTGSGLRHELDRFRRNEISKLHSEAMGLNAKSNLPDFRKRVSLALKEGRIDQRRAMAMIETSLKFEAGNMETYAGLNRAVRILQKEISEGRIDKATGQALLTAFEERREERRKNIVNESKQKSRVEAKLEQRKVREKNR